jgi:hypothetical protein
MALLLEPSESKARAVPILPYCNRNTSQSYGGHGGSFHETSHEAVPRNGPTFADNHYTPPDCYYQFTTDRRQSAGHSHGSLQRQISLPKDPVYVLDSQKSLVSLHKEAFGVQGGNYTRRSPSYSSQRPQNINFQGRNPQDRREDLHYPNQTVIMSNDARFYYERRFGPVDGGARSMPRETFKHTSRKISWPESDFNKVRTVHVTGFPVEPSLGYYLEKLFSECGEVTTVSVADERSYAFIT